MNDTKENIVLKSMHNDNVGRYIRASIDLYSSFIEATWHAGGLCTTSFEDWLDDVVSKNPEMYDSMIRNGIRFAHVSRSDV